MNQLTLDRHPGREHPHRNLGATVIMIVMLEMFTNCHHRLLFLKMIVPHVYHLHHQFKLEQSWILILTRQMPLHQLFSSQTTLSGGGESEKPGNKQLKTMRRDIASL